MCIFAVASTMERTFYLSSSRCELLQNVYLCSSKHNIRTSRRTLPLVVNCFKMCIFAVASTIDAYEVSFGVGCELLQNVYLCSSKHNMKSRRELRSIVVNCFKMCIFAVASTIFRSFLCLNICCELLQNVYLCSSKHNREVVRLLCASVVNCFKMCIFAVASTISFYIEYVKKML